MTFQMQQAVLHYFFMSNNQSNFHSRRWWDCRTCSCPLPHVPLSTFPRHTADDSTWSCCLCLKYTCRPSNPGNHEILLCLVMLCVLCECGVRAPIMFDVFTVVIGHRTTGLFMVHNQNMTHPERQNFQSQTFMSQLLHCNATIGQTYQISQIL